MSLNFKADSFRGDRTVRLDSIRFESNDAILDLRVMVYEGVETWALRRIRAIELREYRIGASEGDLTVLPADHVVVRQHTEPRQELYFRGVPGSVTETIGRMWMSHRQVAGGWISLDRFLNSSAPLNVILAGGCGLVGNGPTFLIEAYSRVLSDEGLNPQTLDAHPAKWWNRRQWLENPATLSAIALGDSFWVARDFEGEELAVEPG